MLHFLHSLTARQWEAATGTATLLSLFWRLSLVAASEAIDIEQTRHIFIQRQGASRVNAEYLCNSFYENSRPYDSAFCLVNNTLLVLILLISDFTA